MIRLPNLIFSAVTWLLILSVLVLYIFFPSLFMGTMPFITNVLFSLLFIFFFFLFCRKINISNFSLFLKHLFWYSQLFCFLYIILQYLLSYYYTPYQFPFTVTGVDQFLYYDLGMNFKKVLQGRMSLASFFSWQNVSDSGFPIWCGTLFYFFGNYHLPIKLFNAVFIGLSAVFLSKTVRIIFNQKIAQLSGILYAFWPTACYMSGLFLKEALMMFLVSIWLFGVVQLTRKFSIRNLCMTLLPVFALFLFRTFMGVFFAIATMVLFFSFAKLRVMVPVIVASFLLLFLSNNFFFSNAPISNLSNSVEEEVEASYFSLLRPDKYFYEKSEKSKALKSIGLIVLAPAGPLLPFPSILDVKTDAESSAIPYRVHLNIIKMVFSFFLYMGLFYIFKNKKVRLFMPFLFPILGIICMIALMGAMTYFRFHFTYLLFAAPIMAYGIYCFRTNYRRNTVLFNIYNTVCFFLIIVFNIIRLSFYI